MSLPTRDPALLLATHLKNTGVVAEPSDSSTSWPIYDGHLPDGTGVPDSAVGIRNTEGTHDGRSQRTGLYWNHHGCQIIVRDRNEANAYAKARAIQNALVAIKRTEVVISDTIYKISSVSLTGPPVFIGREPDGKRRYLFTINLLTRFLGEQKFSLVEISQVVLAQMPPMFALDGWVQSAGGYS